MSPVAIVLVLFGAGMFIVGCVVVGGWGAGLLAGGIAAIIIGGAVEL